MTLGRNTLKWMLDRSRNLCGLGPGSNRENNLLKQAINEAYFALVSQRDWPELERVDEIGLRKADDSAIATLEATEREAPMVRDSIRIKSIQTYSPSYREIRITSPAEVFRMLGASTTVSAPPELACIVGRTAQHKRIAAAGPITLKSNVSTNNNDLVVRVTYRPTDGQVGETIFEDVSGTFSGTGVTLSTQAAAGWSIESVSIPIGWDGNLTIEDASTTVVQIPQRAPGASGEQHHRWYSRLLLRFAPLPDADYSAMLSYRLTPPELSDNTDVPLIPVADVLINRAAAAYFRSQRKLSIAREFEVIAERLVQSIMSNEPIDRTPSLAPRRGVLGMVGVWQRRRY